MMVVVVNTMEVVMMMMAVAAVVKMMQNYVKMNETGFYFFSQRYLLQSWSVERRRKLSSIWVRGMLCHMWYALPSRETS